MAAQPFQIHIEQRVLDDLQRRLQSTRWAPARQRDDAGWSLGTSADYLRRLIAHWQSHYDWRRHEAALNQVPQFKADAGGTRLHFVHAKGRRPRSTPLLLLHGWPDSFYRYSKVIPMLSESDGHGGSFDVVVPSLPGFAFTGPVALPRTQPNRHSAQLLWRLMTEVLGYERFAVAGGDGGSVLAQLLAIDHSHSIIGVHLTDLGWHVGNVDPAKLTRPEQKYLEAAKQRFMADGAYAMVQSTQPRSLAAGLNDSPVGLASWIIDRFHSWSDSRDGLDAAFSKDELLTNIMLYWTTGTIGSSMFGYFADRRSPSLTPANRVERPVGVALFPNDGAGVPPRRFAERTLNVVRWTELPRGGHFAALEVPQLYADDVRDFFDALRDGARAHQQESRHDHPTV